MTSREQHGSDEHVTSAWKSLTGWTTDDSRSKRKSPFQVAVVEATFRSRFLSADSTAVQLDSAGSLEVSEDGRRHTDTGQTIAELTRKGDGDPPPNYLYLAHSDSVKKRPSTSLEKPMAHKMAAMEGIQFDHRIAPIQANSTTQSTGFIELIAAVSPVTIGVSAALIALVVLLIVALFAICLRHHLCCYTRSSSGRRHRYQEQSSARLVKSKQSNDDHGMKLGRCAADVESRRRPGTERRQQPSMRFQVGQKLRTIVFLGSDLNVAKTNWIIHGASTSVGLIDDNKSGLGRDDVMLFDKSHSANGYKQSEKQITAAVVPAEAADSTVHSNLWSISQRRQEAPVAGNSSDRDNVEARFESERPRQVPDIAGIEAFIEETHYARSNTRSLKMSVPDPSLPKTASISVNPNAAFSDDRCTNGPRRGDVADGGEEHFDKDGEKGNTSAAEKARQLMLSPPLVISTKSTEVSDADRNSAGKFMFEVKTLNYAAKPVRH